MSTVVYLNGKYLPVGDALISPDDRGFNFADGVYEVVKYYHGVPFRLEDHLERLAYSLHEVKIKYSVDHQLMRVFAELLKLNGLTNEDAGVYLQITRGQHRRVHHFPEIKTPTVYATVFPFPSFTEKLENGIKVITAPDIRWLRCDIKSVSLLPNTMIYNTAVEQAAGEAILIRDEWVTEATHSSVFGVKNGTVYTHPLSNLILPGITRKVVLEICRSNNIPAVEKAVRAEFLTDLDELFITGTGSEVMPVVQVDETLIGNGKSGKITTQIQELFFRKVREGSKNWV